MPAEKGKKSSWQLSTNEVIALLGMLFSAPIAFATIRVFTMAGDSAWVAGLVAAVFGSLIVLVWVAICVAFPQSELPVIVQSVLGRPLGSLFNVVIGFYFLYEAAVGGRIIGEVMFRVLPGTPMVITLSMALFLATIIARLGPEVMGRLANIHLWVVSSAAILMTAALLRNFSARKLLPVFADGIAPVLNGAITPTALLGHVLLVTFLFPHMKGFSEEERDQGERWRSGVRVGMVGMGITWLFFMILLILEQGVFSAEQASRLSIPALSLVRAIQIGAFFERVEVALVAVWLPAAFIKLSLLLYATSIVTKHLTGTDENRWYVLALAALIIPTALGIAESVPEFIQFTNGAWALFQLAIKVVIPLILLGLILVKGRLGHGH